MILLLSIFEAAEETLNQVYHHVLTPPRPLPLKYVGTPPPPSPYFEMAEETLKSIIMGYPTTTTTTPSFP